MAKAKTLKKESISILRESTKSAKKIQNEVFTVTYEETGSELIALLKESEEIKINRPIYNRMSRKSNFHLAMYSEKDENGYLNLKLQKADGRKKEITSFITSQEGKNAIVSELLLIIIYARN